MPENEWDEILDKLDWEAIDREVQRELEDERERDELLDYFNQQRFDYKRGYIRKLMKAHPEIMDRSVISLATEQMMESHDGGVELEVDDALRFVAGKKPMSASEAVKILTEAGINDSNIVDLILNTPVGGEECGTVVNEAARKKAGWLIRYADVLAKNPDVLILGLPIFYDDANWTQAKLAFFSENLSNGDKGILQQMMKTADVARMSVEHGVAVAVFQLRNIWDDFS